MKVDPEPTGATPGPQAGTSPSADGDPGAGAGPVKPGTGLVKEGWRRVEVRFLFVGVLNTVIGLSIYWLGLRVGLRPELALAVSVVLGALNNFLTTGGLVFRNRDPRLLWRFLIAYAGYFLLNAVLLHGLIADGFHPLLAQVLCTGPMVCLNFLVLRRLVFTA